MTNQMFGILNIAFHHNALGDQYGFLESGWQMAIAICLLLVVLEAARRAIGWPLPLVAGVALVYGLFGQHIPGQFGHSGIPLESFLGTLTIAEGGIWGSLTGVSVGVVAIFVIFGAVLNAGEAGQGFMNVASAAAGRLKGGAAKVSVISSALFGSISGSASANVASTGAVTLPAMEKLGYPKRLAAAVEAAERIRAAGMGLGGILTPTGLGTLIAEGKQTVEVEGKTYLLEPPLRADFALIAARSCDYVGNLAYMLSATNFNPIMALAGDVVIAEPEEIVPIGVIPPDAVKTPGVLVDHVIKRAA